MWFASGCGFVTERIEAVAVRVDEPHERSAAAVPWLDADGVARLLNVERDFVYRHAARLGARRLGDGSRARLRFRLADVEAAFPCVTSKGSPATEPRASKPRTRQSASAGFGTDVPLLPIGGVKQRRGCRT